MGDHSVCLKLVYHGLPSFSRSRSLVHFISTLNFLSDSQIKWKLLGGAYQIMVALN